RGLLSHTSGLAYSPVWSYPSTEAQLKAAFPTGGAHPGAQPRYAYWGYESTPVVGFAEGSTARYSNAGYALLGAVIDTVTQSLPEKERGYERFIWHNVGMNSGVLSDG